MFDLHEGGGGRDGSSSGLAIRNLNRINSVLVYDFSIPVRCWHSSWIPRCSSRPIWVSLHTLRCDFCPRVVVIRKSCIRKKKKKERIE